MPEQNLDTNDDATQAEESTTPLMPGLDDGVKEEPKPKKPYTGKKRGPKPKNKPAPRQAAPDVEEAIGEVPDFNVETPDAEEAILGEAAYFHPYFVVRGEWLSLDLRKRKHITMQGFVVTTKQPSAIVPDEMDADGLKALSILLEAGHLVRGSEHIPIFTRNPGTLKKFVSLLDLTHNMMVTVLGKIVPIHREHCIEGHHVYDILRAMLDHERDHQARPLQMSTLSSALNHVRDNTFRRGPVLNVDADPYLVTKSDRMIVRV